MGSGGPEWTYINWRLDFPEGHKVHINYKELLSLLFAVRRGEGVWSGSTVIVGTDIITARSVIRKGSGTNPVVMRAVRETFWYSVHYDFVIDAFYVSSHNNDLPDAISRLHDLGEVLHLRSILESNNIIYYLLCYDMSNSSLEFLSQKWNKGWTEILHTSGDRHSHLLPKDRTGRLRGRISSSV